MPASPPSRGEPLGAVLAGGAGQRMGGSKGLVTFRGRPLIERPLAALRGVLPEVVVVAKADTPLPPGLTVWVEADEPRHPATGLIHALETCKRGQTPCAVLVCAADVPFVSEELLRALLADDSDAPAVVPRAGGRLQPLVALYRPAALPALRAAGDAPLTATVEALAPAILDWPDETAFFNVNTPEDLRHAEALSRT
jgi:molybdenum cofactor guanylyltransferase